MVTHAHFMASSAAMRAKTPTGIIRQYCCSLSWATIDFRSYLPMRIARLLRIAHANYRSHRTEDFLSERRRIFRDIDKHRRLVEKSGAGNSIAASKEFRAGGDRFLDLFMHAV